MNAWTVGLAGGLLEERPLRLASEMARVVDDGPESRMSFPVVTRGATENMNSLLYLRGIDVGDHQFGRAGRVQDSGAGYRPTDYIFAQSVPVGIAYFRSAGDRELAGSRRQESEFQYPGHRRARYSGPLIFSRLGIKAENTFIPHQVALEQMRKGEMAAVVFITSKPG